MISGNYHSTLGKFKSYLDWPREKSDKKVIKERWFNFQLLKKKKRKKDGAGCSLKISGSNTPWENTAEKVRTAGSKQRDQQNTECFKSITTK